MMKESKELTVRRITVSDDMDLLAGDINAAEWDDENDMGDYSAGSLAAFVADKHRVLVVARCAGQLAGIASAAVQLKPYENQFWLYVDEVDVAVNYRKQGVGKAMMSELLRIGDKHDCTELWLGTEQDNGPAMKLYQSLDPDETEPFVGFTFRFKH
jgi:ribosomal protein S18 acetylase RimI-like enzyme